MSTSDNRIIGFSEAVALAGVAKRTIDNWVEKGWLRPVAEAVPNGRGRPGRKFRASEVLRLAEERAVLVRDAGGNLVRSNR